MRAFDWSANPLGPPAQWPQSLKTAVRIMLTSRQAMFVWWGEQLINLHNDAYKAILGGKHPWALGQPASAVWREIWGQVGPRVASAMLTNEGTYDEALLLIMERNGYPEETYYTFSYSPVPNDEGRPGGIICANTDDTQRIIGERQLALLRELATRSADARTFEEACASSSQSLQSNPWDLPFAMIYLIDAERGRVTLAGTSGISGEHPGVPRVAGLDERSVWPFGEVAATHEPVLIRDLAQRIPNLPTGAWERPPDSAIAVPIAPSGQTGKAGILIAGLNPFRLFDDGYRGFIDLVASQIAASIANAQAYEEERKRAETLAELDRAKTAFFSNVSHEFRTPLTLMLGPLEDLLSKDAQEVPPESHEVLSVMHRNGERLLKLVNTLLDFSRIEAGRVQAVYAPVDLAAYTAELASVFRSAIERAGMRLVIDIQPLPQPVYVDRDMWEKIVLNLISNAFKYTMEGEITVSLKAEGGAAVLRVRDTGSGVPPAELPKLFNRFHRVEGARGRTHEGTGIGLALVQELTKLHGGTVGVVSVMGEGSTFTVSVPLGSEHLPPDQLASAAAPSRPGSGRDYVEQALRWLPDGADESDPRSAQLLVAPELLLAGAAPARRPTVLLADDNDDMRHYVRRLLAGAYDVVAVRDGAEALAAVSARHPELVLTDVMMPNLDGFGLLQALRADPATAAIPVIMLSARAGEEARVEGLHAGADDYLVKPFTARELLARVAGMLAVAKARREHNEALRESEERYRSLVQATAAIVWSTPSSGEFDREQPRWSAFTGQTGEEQQGWGWLAAIHPDDRPRTREVWARALANPGMTEIEHRVRRADGEYRYMAARAIPIIGPDGGVREWIGAHTDITVEKRLQQALESERVRLREIFVRAPAYIAMLRGPEHVFEIANPPYLQLVGDRPNIIGKPVREALPEVKEQGFFELLDSVYTTGEPYIGNEVRVLLGGDGAMAEHFLNFLYQPVRDDEGRVDGIFVHAVDVTAQVRSRQQVEQQAAELEAADRRKDEFMATLSHELRTPLTAILGWARILKMDGNDEATVRTAIDTIDQSAQVQAQLIDDVLDISRITTGKVRIDAATLNVATVATSAMEGVRLAAEAKGILLESDLPPAAEEPLILGDGNRLQQIIWNLLTNAIKFTPEGGAVRLMVRREASAISLSVTDTGIGIHPDFLSHVFEPFRQAESASTRLHGGLGLGLSIVRYLVELHGGQITAASEGEGKGATFTVVFPRLRRRAVPSAAVVSPSASLPKRDGAETLDLAGLSVLVVDDQQAIREYLMAVLRRGGAEARAVSSVQEGIRAVESRPPEVVLCDIAMPREDGFAFLQWIRSIAWPRRIFVFAVTALGRPEDEQRMLASGFDGVIRKPVEPATLVRVVAAARAERASRAE